MGGQIPIIGRKPVQPPAERRLVHDINKVAALMEKMFGGTGTQYYLVMRCPKALQPTTAVTDFHAAFNTNMADGHAFVLQALEPMRRAVAQDPDAEEETEH